MDLWFEVAITVGLFIGLLILWYELKIIQVTLENGLHHLRGTIRDYIKYLIHLEKP